MNFRLIANILGYIMLVEAGFMLFPLAVALYYGEGTWTAFLYSACICAAAGWLSLRVPLKRRRMHRREGYLAVAAAWLVLGLLGALPYIFTDAIPNYIDAVFETISGLTTTGSTILTEIEHLPRSVLFWRSLTQWMGGMGVLVLFLALMPKLGAGAVYLMRAESPGPIKSKLVPKVGETAKILYGIYTGLTVLEIIALRLAGMRWFDAINHAFTTLATGGFSVKNTSIAAYSASPAILWIITVFTFLAGVNFSLVFWIIRGHIKDVLRNSELRLYTAVIAVATLLISLNLCIQSGLPLGESVGGAAFQVVTIMTTTGYATKDFALWPAFSQTILVILMFAGGCAGSTAGGFKISRIQILVKSLRRDLQRISHPNHVSVITVDGQMVEEHVVASAQAYTVAYLLILLSGTLVVSWDNLGFTESFVAALTCLSNVGPGLGLLGPMANFAGLSLFSKAVLSLLMLLGRLEIMPILMLMNPGSWKD